MLCDKSLRALICYAGSAPEASIGSKPIGSELKHNIGTKTLTSQEYSTPNCRTASALFLFSIAQLIVSIVYYFSPQGAGGRR